MKKKLQINRGLPFLPLLYLLQYILTWSFVQYFCYYSIHIYLRGCNFLQLYLYFMTVFHVFIFFVSFLERLMLKIKSKNCKF